MTTDCWVWGGIGSSTGQLPGGSPGRAGRGLGLFSGTLKGAESEKRKRKSLTHAWRGPEETRVVEVLVKGNHARGEGMPHSSPLPSQASIRKESLGIWA